jgi:hypothetical protein
MDNLLWKWLWKGGIMAGIVAGIAATVADSERLSPYVVYCLMGACVAIGLVGLLLDLKPWRWPVFHRASKTARKCTDQERLALQEILAEAQKELDGLVSIVGKDLDLESVWSEAIAMHRSISKYPRSPELPSYPLTREDALAYFQKVRDWIDARNLYSSP